MCAMEEQQKLDQLAYSHIEEKYVQKETTALKDHKYPHHVLLELIMQSLGQLKSLSVCFVQRIHLMI